MGKQIQFYMTDQDEDEFIRFAKSNGDVLILPQVSETQLGEAFSSFRDLAGRRLGEGCHLWNRSLSPKPRVDYFPVHGGCYCLDFMQSEVVNVMRSKKLDEQLSKGRLHIEDTVLQSDGTIAAKSAHFMKWFSELSHWIKNSYPSKFSGAFVSSRVESLTLSGIELIGHFS